MTVNMLEGLVLDEHLLTEYNVSTINHYFVEFNTIVVALWSLLGLI